MSYQKSFVLLVAALLQSSAFSASFRWNSQGTSTYQLRQKVSIRDLKFKMNPSPETKQTVLLTGRVTHKPGGRLQYTHLRAKPAPAGQESLDSYTFQGFRSDGTFPDNQAKDQVFEALFHLPQKNLSIGEVASESATQPGLVGKHLIQVSGTRRVRYVKNETVKRRTLAKLEISMELTSVKLPPGVKGKCDCSVRADAVVLFDLETQSVGAAWGRYDASFDADLTRQGEVVHQRNRTGQARGPGSQSTRTARYSGQDTWMQIVRTDLPESVIPRHGFANPLDFHHSVQAAARFAKGIPYKKGGTDRKGLGSTEFIAWTYNQFGIELPAQIEALSRRGAKISDLNSVQPGDVLFYRKDKSPTPAIAALALDSTSMAYMHPGKEWRTLPLNHKAFAPRFLFARRMVQP